MNIAVYYRPDGCIEATESWLLDEPPEPKYDCAVLLYDGGDLVEYDTHFVKGGKLHRIPVERPAVSYPVRFDPASRGWADARTNRETSYDEKQALKGALAQKLRSFDWQGARFQVDGDSLARANEKLAGGSENAIKWRTTDNRFYAFSSDEFRQFVKAATQYSEAALFAYWQAVDSLPQD